MKNVLIASLILLVSCVNLTENPKGILTPSTLFTTEAGFNTAITGMYYQLYNTYNGYDYAYPIMAGAGAEDVATYPTAKVFAGLDVLKPTSSTYTLQAVWQISYLAIASANAIIQNSNGSTTLSPQVVQQFEGEAKFIRAFSYFNLTRWFGKVPIITEANQLTSDQVGESAESDIYTQIISDLTFASAHLSNDATLTSRPNIYTAQALLAKVYLTMTGYPIKDASKYPMARDLALSVINSGSYNLVANFSDLWNGTTKLQNSELMFGFYGSYGIASVGSHLHLATRPWEGGENGWGDFYSEARFLNNFPAGNRLDASFHLTFEDGTLWSNSKEDAPFISKYRDGGLACGPDDATCAPNGNGIFVVLRYADVLLMYAEAANMAEGSPSSAAYNAVNQVRRRAVGADISQPNPSVDLSGLSQADFDAAILNERNWELAFEGNRWFDLVRKELVVQVNSALYPYVDSHNLLLPKPASELALSQGLINQNPGY